MTGPEQEPIEARGDIHEGDYEELVVLKRGRKAIAKALNMKLGDVERAIRFHSVLIDTLTSTLDLLQAFQDKWVGEGSVNLQPGIDSARKIIRHATGKESAN